MLHNYFVYYQNFAFSSVLQEQSSLRQSEVLGNSAPVPVILEADGSSMPVDSIKEKDIPSAIILKRTFPNLVLSELGEAEMKKLERRLFLESSNLSCKFHMLCSELYLSMRRRNVEKEDLVASLMGLDTFQPVFKSQNQPLFRDQKQKLIEAKNLAKIWEIISFYHSYFN